MIDLTPYDRRQSWTSADASHLLRRTQFGAAPEEVELAVAEGLETTVTRLLAADRPESESFVLAERALFDAAFASADVKDIQAWWLYRMTQSTNPFPEKLTLFWHNHFATSFAKVQSIPAMVTHLQLFRRSGLGKFRDLVTAVARDPAMLDWLDGNANRKRAANENFARELMELFTLGEGNYTEQDIKEAARAFTGWHTRNGKFWFNEHQHDVGEKLVFGKRGPFNGDEIIDLCLKQPACSRFLATKLLREFVTPRPTVDTVETLAECLREHDFDFQAVLRILFQSRGFFDPQYRRCLIKSPVELVVGSCRTLRVTPQLQKIRELLARLGQDLLHPPTVKGWEGDRLWINSATMVWRTNFANELACSQRFGQLPDLVAFAQQQGATTPEAILDFYLTTLFGELDAGPDRQVLLEHLRVGAADKPLAERLQGVLHLLLAAPEYQLH